jgi:predicted phosphodiesterase
MRIALLSDIHGNVTALRAVVAALPTVDMVLHAGDAVGYFAHGDAVCDLLQSMEARCIAGNHDRFLSVPPGDPNPLLRRSLDMTHALTGENARNWLASLPSSLRLPCGPRLVRLHHGSPWDPDAYVHQDADRERFAGLDADIVVLGHTHRPLLFQAGRTLVINPGSVGLPRDGDRRAAFAVVDTESMTATFGRASWDAAPELAAVTPWGLRQSLARHVAPWESEGQG